jgi:hypothetical protein
MTLEFTGGRRELFTVDKHRDLWLDRISTLLSLPSRSLAGMATRRIGTGPSPYPTGPPC